VILDLSRFIARERPHWQERKLNGITSGSVDLSDLKMSREVLALFQRACSDLSRIGAANAEPELRMYLETLVGRGYAEIHAAHGRSHRFQPVHWFMRVLPRTFRAHARAFAMSLLITMVGMFVGAAVLKLSPEGRAVALAAFPHVAHTSPTERVRAEERNAVDNAKRINDQTGSFSGMLMTHNTKVSMMTMALGLTYGLGTVLLLFYNGVILGGVVMDYIWDGQGVFMVAWLLPHGSFEITAILIAGQAGLLLARALIGWGTRDGLRARMRKLAPDVATLMGGVALMLVWAGIVEAFFSQYHAPVLPYWVKITFGSLELALVIAFYGWCGRKLSAEEAAAA
jgi:uncharacterized membrane protein SpoIIM required for sporulation